MATSSKVPRGARRPAPVAMDGPVPVRLDQLDRDRVDEPPMRKRPASSSELRVGILLWPGFPLLSLAGLCDGLRHAADIGDQSRQVRCSWAILGRPGDSVAASCNARVQTDPVELKKIIREAIHSLRVQTGCNVIEGEVAAFQPGYPMPVHRITT